MPNLFIIAGPNGAGKTTYVRDYLSPETGCREFVNADLIAAGLSPFSPDTAAFEAGRIMLKRLRDLSAQRRDFAFETTLTVMDIWIYCLICGKLVTVFGWITCGFATSTSRGSG